MIDGDKMNKTVLPSLLVLLGIVGVIGLMAATSVFDPIIRFIHTDSLTVNDAILCLAFTVAGFFACFKLLNVLCTYFVPKIESDQKHACAQDMQK